MKSEQLQDQSIDGSSRMWMFNNAVPTIVRSNKRDDRQLEDMLFNDNNEKQNAHGSDYALSEKVDDLDLNIPKTVWLIGEDHPSKDERHENAEKDQPSNKRSKIQ